MGQCGRLLRTVLLVEPETDLARIMERTLRDLRLVVTSVTTGREALELLENQRPDSVILDPELPDGAGVELIDCLRQLGRIENPGPVWIVVSYLDRATFVRRYGRPLPLYLTKPFDPGELVRLLESQFA